MLRIFLFSILCLPVMLLGDDSSKTISSKTISSKTISSKSIDMQIKELQEQRRSCKLQAAIAGRNADQLMTQDWLSYKREVQKEELMEERMGQIDKEIEALEKKKQKLLNQK